MTYTHAPLFPLGEDKTLSAHHHRRRAHRKRWATRIPRRRPRGDPQIVGSGDGRHQSPVAPRPSRTARQRFSTIRKPPRTTSSSPRPPEERQHLGRRRIADARTRAPPSSWARRPLRLHRRLRRERHRGRRARRLREEEPALFAARAAVDVRREEHQEQSAGADRHLCEGEDAYKFLFMAKGGGSANKTFLYQATLSLLTHDRLVNFPKENPHARHRRLPALSPGIVIGGTSAEINLKTVKLASARYLDELPTEGGDDGHAFRDLEMEAEIPQADAGARRRRAIRRQVFLP